MLKDEKILITGPTSQVALPVAEVLAKDNEVLGLARFTKSEDRDKIEALGVKTIAADLAESNLAEVPEESDFPGVANGRQPHRLQGAGAGRELEGSTDGENESDRWPCNPSGHQHFPGSWFHLCEA